MIKSISLNYTIAVFMAIALVLSLVPAFALADDTIVENENTAVVVNEVVSGANTGGNSAGGSTGGAGGRGGSIRNEGGEQDVDTSTTGAGGNGGNAGLGGTVTTGNAMATAWLDNTVNDNSADIDLCACPTPEEEEEEDEEVHHDRNIRVHNMNNGTVVNGVGALADTGYNGADGSMGGEGGKGGSIKNTGYVGEGQEGSGVQEVDDSTTGMGGMGGTGSDGGLITSGMSESHADVMTVVNRNVTRIRR